MKISNKILTFFIRSLSDLRSLSSYYKYCEISHILQKISHAAADWFPKSTAECIGLMLNSKTNPNLCPLPAWFPKNMMIRYAPLQTWKASQLPHAISLAVMNRIANEIEG